MIREVEAVFNSYPKKIRNKLLLVRELILDVALDVDEIEETLKWGEPSYLPVAPNTGTTIRIAWKPSLGDHYGMYFNCKTNLISSFKRKYPHNFTYEGKRCILFYVDDNIDTDALKDCIQMALTYHLKP